MDTNQQLELFRLYDWKRPKEGNPDEYHVIRVTEDLEVFCNGELEGKIRMFRNGNFSYFGYTLQSVDEAEAKVVWNPPPSKKKKDAPAKGPVVWLRLEANGTDEVKVIAPPQAKTRKTTEVKKTNKAMAEAMAPVAQKATEEAGAEAAEGAHDKSPAAEAAAPVTAPADPPREVLAAPEPEPAAEEADAEATNENAGKAPEPEAAAEEAAPDPEAPAEAAEPEKPAKAPAESPAEDEVAGEDEEMPQEEVKDEVKEEVKPGLDELKQEPFGLKTEATDGSGGEVSFVQNEKVDAFISGDDNDGEWYPGTISKVNAESGRVEYTVKWDDCDKDEGEEEETDGFSAADLRPRGEEDFPVPSLKRSADTDGEPPLKRQAVEGSS
jgi:hypothetical protein